MIEGDSRSSGEVVASRSPTAERVPPHLRKLIIDGGAVWSGKRGTLKSGPTVARDFSITDYISEDRGTY